MYLKKEYNHNKILYCYCIQSQLHLLLLPRFSIERELLDTVGIFPGLCVPSHQSIRPSVFDFAFLRYHLSIYSDHYSYKYNFITFIDFLTKIFLNSWYLLFRSYLRTCIGPLSSVITEEIVITLHKIIAYFYIQKNFPSFFSERGYNVTLLFKVAVP